MFTLDEHHYLAFDVIRPVAMVARPSHHPYFFVSFNVERDRCGLVCPPTISKEPFDSDKVCEQN